MKKYIIPIILILLIIFNIYRIYDKTKDINLLSEHIIKTQKLQNINNTFIYKGNIDNNYVLFNNLSWRIIKINKDSSITLILNDYINILPQNKINEFLNNLLNNLNKDYLIKNKICNDEIKDNEVTCNNISNNNYIDLLSAYDYLNSFNNESFITNNNEIIWLNNNYITNNNKLSTTSSDNYLEIKPIITLKPKTIYKDGDGTINNPFIIDDETFGLGSKVKLGNDLYIVYNYDKDIKLISINNIEGLTKKDATNYLNNTLYNKLSYKNIIIDKIKFPNIMDIKIDNSITNYYLEEKIDDFDIIYNNPIIYADESIKHNTRYTITISKDTNFKKENNIYVYKDGNI